MTDTKKELIVRGETLPPASRVEVEMPEGTPLGLGFLGAMRFDAIRRVLDHYQLALRSAVQVRDAEAEYYNALARRARSHEQLMNLDTIRETERTRLFMEAARVEEEAAIAKLRRTLQHLELETSIAEQQGKLQKAKEQHNKPDKKEMPVEIKDEFTDLFAQLRRLPDLAKAMIAVKGEIIKEYGGEDKLGEEGQQLIDALNALSNAVVQKSFEKKLA